MATGPARTVQLRFEITAARRGPRRDIPAGPARTPGAGAGGATSSPGLSQSMCPWAPGKKTPQVCLWSSTGASPPGNSTPGRARVSAATSAQRPANGRSQRCSGSYRMHPGRSTAPVRCRSSPPTRRARCSRARSAPTRYDGRDRRLPVRGQADGGARSRHRLAGGPPRRCLSAPRGCPRAASPPGSRSSRPSNSQPPRKRLPGTWGLACANGVYRACYEAVALEEPDKAGKVGRCVRGGR